MNKLLIVLLAVCLVSVHAFVKREAEGATEKNIFGDSLSAIQASAKDIEAKMTEVFKPENIKKQFSDFLDSANKAIKDLTNSAGSQNKDNKQ